MGLKLTGQVSLDSQTSVGSEASTSSTNSTSSSCTISQGSHKCLAILHGQSLHVVALAVSEEFLYAGSNNGDIRAWDYSDMQEGAKFGKGEAAVKCLIVVGEQIISAHQDHKIRVWRRSKTQPQEHRLVTTLPSVKDYITNFLPSKNYVRVRRHHKCLWINHHDSVSTLALGNNVLYSGSWDKSIKVWRLSDFKCLESLTHHVDAINALAVDNPANLLFSGSSDTTIKVFHNNPPKPTKTRHTLIATLTTNSCVNALALALAPPLLYSAQSDKTIRMWKMKEADDDGTKTWSAVGALRGHRLAVLCVVTLSNLVISGSADKTVRVWKRCGDGAHNLVSVMVGHAGPVKSLCGVLDVAMGALIISGSMDGDIRVWWIPEDETNLVSSDDGAPDSPVLVNWRTSRRTLPILPSV